MPEDLDPNKELIIVPLNTEQRTSIFEGLGELIREEFSMKYSIVRVDSPFFIFSVDSSRRLEKYNADALILDSLLGGSGLFRSLFERYRTQHVLAVTDMYLTKYNGELNEGAINKARDKAAISCARFKDDDPEKILERLSGLALHEVGHLHWLKEHVHKSQNGKYCPMISGEYLLKPLGFVSTDIKKFDCLDNKLCSDCKNYLMS
ncbi:MAG: hypothetical protein V1831_01240 [Candidatus Woesearchaeota archaeon]